MSRLASEARKIVTPAGCQCAPELADKRWLPLRRVRVVCVGLCMCMLHVSVNRQSDSTTREERAVTLSRFVSVCRSFSAVAVKCQQRTAAEFILHWILPQNSTERFFFRFFWIVVLGSCERLNSHLDSCINNRENARNIISVKLVRFAHHHRCCAFQKTSLAGNKNFHPQQNSKLKWKVVVGEGGKASNWPNLQLLLTRFCDLVIALLDFLLCFMRNETQSNHPRMRKLVWIMPPQFDSFGVFDS